MYVTWFKVDLLASYIPVQDSKNSIDFFWFSSFWLYENESKLGVGEYV